MFGVPDERLGEVPAAVIYCEEPGSVTPEEITAFLSERLAQYKLPAQIWIHDEPLPKLGTGKIDKVMLRDRYRRQAGAAA